MDGNQTVAEELVRRANALHRQGAYEEAIIVYRQAIGLMPNVPTYTAYNFMIGDMLEEMRRYEEAVLAYRETVGAIPHYDEAWSNLGKCLLELERNDEATQAFERCLEIMLPRADEVNLEPFYDLEIKDRTSEAWYYVAVAYARLGCAEKAAAGLKQALQLRPSWKRRAQQDSLLREYLPDDEV